MGEIGNNTTQVVLALIALCGTFVTSAVGLIVVLRGQSRAGAAHASLDVKVEAAKVAAETIAQALTPPSPLPVLPATPESGPESVPNTTTPEG